MMTKMMTNMIGKMMRNESENRDLSNGFYSGCLFDRSLLFLEQHDILIHFFIAIKIDMQVEVYYR